MLSQVRHVLDHGDNQDPSNSSRLNIFIIMAQNAIKDQGSNVASAGKDWDRMTEDQQKQMFDKLPDDQKKGKTYVEWLKEGYHDQYENWMPWIEDQYLRWFTNDNKTSYAAKENLDKTKITGNEQVDTLQDGVNNLAAGQVGKGGLLQPLGDMTSKEGINRVERGGKDEHGNQVPSESSGITGAASTAGQNAYAGAQNVGGYVGGMLPGSKS
ncbi:hypothetical protein AMS68_000974 [Peltaster fructicola]|uniref:Uncharacterized protein n=1 Tax=Peltaster fructicola TaxID=286661 RepID=A0A6H0XL33_9PEZI|nr:hypothetical protein AMS68_000974 [Peltaster fructicola]